jgi:thiamine pyrophosphate-dependent acetolactate synthase large subunit-like protein
MEALRIRQEKIRFVQVRHEESAAFMACAYAKYTGKLGVCLGTSGTGGIHLLNARACGGHGFAIDNPAACEALAARGPVLIEAVEQATHMV